MAKNAENSVILCPRAHAAFYFTSQIHYQIICTSRKPALQTGIWKLHHFERVSSSCKKRLIYDIGFIVPLSF